MLVACIVISIIGIYMEFFYEPTDKKESKNQGLEIESSEDEGGQNMSNKYDYSQKELPNVDNKSSDETYTDGENIEVYFSNTEVLDNGRLPLSVQSKLNMITQRFLYSNGYEDVQELYIDQESYIETEDEIRFCCFMDGHEEQLQIQYDEKEKKIKFSVIEKDNK